LQAPHQRSLSSAKAALKLSLAVLQEAQGMTDYNASNFHEASTMPSDERSSVESSLAAVL
jgi:hypothetical protein